MQLTKTDIQDEALNAILPYQNCAVDISMGVGKTLLGLKHLDLFREMDPDPRPALIVAPKVSIFESWKNDAIKHDLSHLLDNIEFVTYLSLNKKDPNNYSAVYFDEFQNLRDNHVGFLNSYQGKSLGLSGTPPSDLQNDLIGVMLRNLFPIVYQYKIDDAVRDGLLNDYKIYVHMISLDDKKNHPVKTSNGGKFYTSELEVYNYWTDRIDNSNIFDKKKARIGRLSQMKQFGSKEKYAKRLLDRIKDKCIVFANTKEQAESICEYSYYSGNELSDYNLQLFKNGQIDEMSCVLQLSEGINIPNLKQGIIMHAYGNNNKTAQRLGRLMRLNPLDTSFAHILCYKNTIDEHWVKQSLLDFDQSKIIYGNWNI